MSHKYRRYVSTNANVFVVKYCTNGSNAKNVLREIVISWRIQKRKIKDQLNVTKVYIFMNI